MSVTDFNDSAKRGLKAVRSSIETAAGKRSAVPHFRSTAAGLEFLDVATDGTQAEPFKVCSPLKVVAKARNHKSEEWGRLVEWTDPDGQQHTWAAPASMLIGDGREFARELAAGGVEITPGPRALQLLLRYVMQERVKERARCVTAPGWHGTAYVLPSGESFGAAGELIVYQHAGGLVDHHDTAGTLAEWRRAVGALCVGNSRLGFAVSAMFAGPLLRFTGEAGGGFNLVGGSSSGKSTVLRVAASVAGSADYAREWRATSNGLEGVAVLHNDATLILDELAQIDPRQAGEAAYLLANGSGKHRGDRNGSARAVARWRTLILSAGEIGLAEHIAEAGKRARAGQSVRLVDIPAEVDGGHGAFEQLQGQANGAAFSAVLKEAASRVYGSPWRPWLEWLAKQDPTRVAVDLKAAIDRFRAMHVAKGADGQVIRVAERFGLVAAAGELASKAKLTGWKTGEATSAAAACFTAWMIERGGHGSAEDAALLAQVRSFLEANGESRFEPVSGYKGPPIRDRAGFIRRNGIEQREYLVLPEQFKMICGGYRKDRAIQALINAGWLIPEPYAGTGPKRTTQRENLAELGRVRVYVLSAGAIHGAES